jgi:hypothetical protein
MPREKHATAPEALGDKGMACGPRGPRQDLCVDLGANGALNIVSASSSLMRSASPPSRS